MPKKKATTAKATKKNDNQYLADDGKKATLLTKEGLENLKEEFEYLQTVKRKEVAARIKEAISYGDLSENSEYDEAKNEQAFVEGRILELDAKIQHAKIIASTGAGSESVQLGTTVHVKNLTTGDSEVFTIVGSTEADPFEGKISNESPIGGALLDRKKGDKIEVEVPGGTVEYEVKKIV